MKQVMTLLSLLGILIISPCQIVFAEQSSYADTIPPEILKRYDPDVLSGKLPKIATITQAMIWGLRSQPNQGGDVYKFDLDVSKISSVQKKLYRSG